MDTVNNCKLAILYLLSEAGTPLTQRQLDEILIGAVGLNYFDLATATAELRDQNLIARIALPGGEGLQIRQAGKKVIASLQEDISPRLYELLSNYMLSNKRDIVMQTQRGAEFECIAHQQYVCDLFLADGALELLRIKLNVVSEEEAKTVCAAWREAAPSLYSRITEGLVGKREKIKL